MARSTLFDRLNHELEVIGRKAQAALDEGKLQIELMRVRRKRDSAARDLGLLIHRRERGAESEPKRTEALLLRLDDLEADLARLDRQISEARRRPSPAAPASAAAGASAPGASASAASAPGASAGAASAPGASGTASPDPTQPAASAPV